MRSKGGTLRAQWLGKLLRDLRESAGLSLRDAGDHIIRDPSAVSRMETGSVPARISDVRELMNLYGVDDPELRAGLEILARDIWVKGWWDGYARNFHVRVIDLAWLEARAEKLRNFSSLVIDGLLQTRDYAEAVMRAIDPEVPDKQISQWLEFRMKRQEVLDRQVYTAILDEAVFHRPFGGPTALREQLAHLLTISERPNITLRVLPFSASTLAGPESAFTLLTMPAPFPVVAQVNAETGAIYVEMPKAARFEAAYARFERHALDTEESRVFIKTRMEQLS
ncbi:MAG TPA: helix-turn-helix transcriptional regulator [Micromonosporaceae bacterium]